MFGLGVWINSEILIAIGGAYLAFLWLPISPEKVVTFAIGFFLVRRLFPKHYHSLRTQIEEASQSSMGPPSSADSTQPKPTDKSTENSARLPDTTNVEPRSDDYTSE